MSSSKKLPLKLNRNDFKKLTKLRVREAKVLLDNNCFEGAYYLLGYAIECALKACVAKQINRFDFPDKDFVNKSYTHKLEDLLDLSGLKNQLQTEIKNNKELRTNWDVVVLWSEEERYVHSKAKIYAKNLYSAVTARKNGILTWIKKLW